MVNCQDFLLLPIHECSETGYCSTCTAHVFRLMCVSSFVTLMTNEINHFISLKLIGARSILTVRIFKFLQCEAAVTYGISMYSHSAAVRFRYVIILVVRFLF